MMLGALLEEKLREHHRQLDLPRSAEVSGRQLTVDRHHRQLEIVVADHVTELPDHLLDANISAGVPGADVAGECELERLAGSPGFLVHPERPLDGDGLDEAVHDLHQDVVRL